MRFNSGRKQESILKRRLIVFERESFIWFYFLCFTFIRRSNSKVFNRIIKAKGQRRLKPAIITGQSSRNSGFDHSIRPFQRVVCSVSSFCRRFIVDPPSKRFLDESQKTFSSVFPSFFIFQINSEFIQLIYRSSQLWISVEIQLIYLFNSRQVPLTWNKSILIIISIIINIILYIQY